MKKTFILFILFLILSNVKLSAQCAQLSNIYTFTYGGHTYEIVKEMKTWANASACAIERGGYLVEINDVNEQVAVYNAISSAGISSTYTSVANGGGIAYIWIGATDQSNEGTWIWDGNNDNSGNQFWTGEGVNGLGNGSSVNGAYNNWGGTSTGTRNEPDNFGSGQNHAAIGLAGWPAGTTMLGIASEWNDIIGSSLLYFIIEKNSNVNINSINNQNGIKVFPNPCEDILFIDKQNNFEKTTFEIFDITGKSLLKGIFNEKDEIKTQSLNKGIYFIKIESETSTNIIKIIKN